ncbi:uncharacterized protein PSFLO_05281 [Pseudozyma flocculosa]|uniref:Uncharacterized protein n=1 Tax=Pseudozyma flocculosa TaxID=84751 RepID=A0A5C3F6L2_9BASI|nr:uncharacterized protein PSFLO_05281 [Pseudozyma flocculosa]
MHAYVAGPQQVRATNSSPLGGKTKARRGRQAPLRRRACHRRDQKQAKAALFGLLTASVCLCNCIHLCPACDEARPETIRERPKLGLGAPPQLYVELTGVEAETQPPKSIALVGMAGGARPGVDRERGGTKKTTDRRTKGIVDAAVPAFLACTEEFREQAGGAAVLADEMERWGRRVIGHERPALARDHLAYLCGRAVQHGIKGGGCKGTPRVYSAGETAKQGVAQSVSSLSSCPGAHRPDVGSTEEMKGRWAGPVGEQGKNAPHLP